MIKTNLAIYSGYSTLFCIINLAFAANANAINLFTQTKSYASEPVTTNPQSLPILTFDKFNPTAEQTITSITFTFTPTVIASAAGFNNSGSTQLVTINVTAPSFKSTIDAISKQTTLTSTSTTQSTPQLSIANNTFGFSTVTFNESLVESIISSDFSSFTGSGPYTISSQLFDDATYSGDNSNVFVGGSTTAGLTVTASFDGTSAPVPFDFSPNAGIAMMGGFYVLGKFIQRVKKKNQ